MTRNLRGDILASLLPRWYARWALDRHLMMAMQEGLLPEGKPEKAKELNKQPETGSVSLFNNGTDAFSIPKPVAPAFGANLTTSNTIVSSDKNPTSIFSYGLQSSAVNGSSISPTVYGYKSTPCPCAICAAALADSAMSPRFPFAPNTKAEDFLIGPKKQGPSTPDHKPDTRLKPSNGSSNGTGRPPRLQGQVQDAGSTSEASIQAQPIGITDIANSEVFSLSSNAGASKTIHLDFNGYNTSNTAWNQQPSSSDNITSIPAFSLDTIIDTNYSQAELDAIKEIFLRVAADYAPFNVNVTTATPAVSSIVRANASDTIYGTVAAIGNVSDTVFPGAGGIAYVGIYNLTESSTAANSGSYYKPALVFPNRLGNNAKNIAEAISHEVGHNLNLSHDGTTSASYYKGGGSSPGWAPIMGVGYDEPLVQFSRGEYSGSNNTENDFTNINLQGVGRYLDEDNTSIAFAEEVTLDSTGYGGAYGMVNLMSDDGLAPVDSDFFKFTAPASGTATISVGNALIYTKNGGTSYLGSDLPAGYGNAHLDAQILNSSGGTIADWSTNSQQDVTSLSALVNAGQTYYVKVMPNAQLSDLSFGETTWGSLGDYVLRIQAPISTNTSAPTVNLAVSPPSASVSENGAPNLVYTFTRTDPSTSPLTVNYTVSGTATLGTDYTGISTTGITKTLSFSAGSKVATVTVNPTADIIAEPNETVALTLASGAGYTVGTTSSVMGTIVNDDIIGTANADILTGTPMAEFIDGRAGRDILTGGSGPDVFGFRFTQSTVGAPDRVTDFAFGTDKIDLFSSTGAAVAIPSAFSRAANNSTATTLSSLATAVFKDANGQLINNQPLAAGAAVLVTSTNLLIAGTYLLINDATSTLSTTNDLMINITGYTGTLPALGAITPPSSVFV